MAEQAIDGEKKTGRGSGTIWWMAAALIVIVGAVLARGLGTEFIDFDDGPYAFQNPNVMGGLTEKNIAWAFQPDIHAGFWIPLTYLSLQLDATLTGPEQIPVAHPEARMQGAMPPLPIATVFKAQNLFWHMVATFFLFLFIYRATGMRQAAFWVALLWAIHPLRVESVAWVAERKDVLAGAFGFWAAYLYVGWAKQGGGARYFATCVIFAMSLMFKPMCVTLPFALVVVDGWPLGRIQSIKDIGRRILEKWGLILLSAGSSIVAVVTQRMSNAVNPLTNISMGLRIENAILGYGMYLLRQFRVWDLAIYYPIDKQMALWPAACSGLILAFVTWVCIAQRRRRPWLLMGWLWFLGTLVPMIGIVLVGEQSYADRFSYLPAVGLMVMVVFTLGDPLLRLRREMRIGLAIVAVAFCVSFSFIQLGRWQNSITLFKWTVDHTEHNFPIYVMLGNAYLREGENAEAEQAYLVAAEENQTSDSGWMRLGEMHFQMGRFDKAAQDFYRAFRTNPRNELAVRRYGESLYALGKLEEAIQTFRVCLTAVPGDKKAAEALQNAEEDLAKRRAATQDARPIEVIHP